MDKKKNVKLFKNGYSNIWCKKIKYTNRALNKLVSIIK